MRKLLALSCFLLLASAAHAQSFTLKLSSCTPPPSPAKFLADGSGAGAHGITPGGGIWAYLGYQGASVTWACTVNVPIAGDYTVSVGAASIYSGITAHFESPAGTKLGSFTIQNTNSWFNYASVTTKLTLPSGQIPLLFVLDARPASNYATNLDDTLTFTAAQPAPIFGNYVIMGGLRYCKLCDKTDDSITGLNLLAGLKVVLMQLDANSALIGSISMVMDANANIFGNDGFTMNASFPLHFFVGVYMPDGTQVPSLANKIDVDPIHLQGQGSLHIVIRLDKDTPIVVRGVDWWTGQ